MMLHAPGVYRAQSDSELLAGVMRAHGLAAGRDVLDVGTGSGTLAIAADRAGAASVTAVDLSRRSCATAWLNGRLHGARVSVHRGDLLRPVHGRRFGLVLANPPYVPSESARLPRHRLARSWEAGPDGRAVLDPLCAGLGDVLAPDGRALVVHSEMCGVGATLTALESCGLAARVLAVADVPFGPVLRGRVRMLRSRGLIDPDAAVETLVVVEARRG